MLRSSCKAEINSRRRRAAREAGRRLVYATCSILEEENRGIVEDFLRNNRFKLRPAGDVLEKGGIRLHMEQYLELWPHRHAPTPSSLAVLERDA